MRGVQGNGYSGELPFANKDQIKDIDENPYELEDVSPETKKIVMKCLEKDKKKRFIDMEEVLAALKTISLKSREVGEGKRVGPVDLEPPPVATAVLVSASARTINKTLGELKRSVIGKQS